MIRVEASRLAGDAIGAEQRLDGRCSGMEMIGLVAEDLPCDPKARKNLRSIKNGNNKMNGRWFVEI